MPKATKDNIAHDIELIKAEIEKILKPFDAYLYFYFNGEITTSLELSFPDKSAPMNLAIQVNYLENKTHLQQCLSTLNALNDDNNIALENYMREIKAKMDAIDQHAQIKETEKGIILPSAHEYYVENFVYETENEIPATTYYHTGKISIKKDFLDDKRYHTQALDNKDAPIGKMKREDAPPKLSVKLLKDSQLIFDMDYEHLDENGLPKITLSENQPEATIKLEENEIKLSQNNDEPVTTQHDSEMLESFSNSENDSRPEVIIGDPQAPSSKHENSATIPTEMPISDRSINQEASNDASKTRISQRDSDDFIFPFSANPEIVGLSSDSENSSEAEVIIGDPQALSSEDESSAEISISEEHKLNVDQETSDDAMIDTREDKSIDNAASEGSLSSKPPSSPIVDLTEVQAYIDTLKLLNKSEVIKNLLKESEQLETKITQLNDYINRKQKQGQLISQADHDMAAKLQKQLDTILEDIKKLAEKMSEHPKTIQAVINSIESYKTSGVTVKVGSDNFVAEAAQKKIERLCTTLAEQVTIPDEIIKKLNSDADKITEANTLLDNNITQKNINENITVDFNQNGNATLSGVKYEEDKSISKTSSENIAYEQSKTNTILKTSDAKKGISFKTYFEMFYNEYQRRGTEQKIYIVANSKRALVCLIAAARVLNIPKEMLVFQKQNKDGKIENYPTDEIDEIFKSMSLHNNDVTPISLEHHNIAGYENQTSKDLYREVKKYAAERELTKDRQLTSNFKRERKKSKEAPIFSSDLLSTATTTFSENITKGKKTETQLKNDKSESQTNNRFSP